MNITNNYLRSILIFISISVSIFLSIILYRIICFQVNIFEFDTSIFINMTLGSVKEFIPNISNSNINTVWSCPDLTLPLCENLTKKNIQINDVLPIEYSSGFLMSIFTALFSRLFIDKTLINGGDPSLAAFSSIVKGYSLYCVSIYLICFGVINYISNKLEKKKLIDFFEKNLLTLAFLLVPFLGVPHVTDRIVGEFISVIYASAAFLITVISALASIKLRNLSLKDTIFFKNKILKISCFVFLFIFLSIEAKSSMIPVCFAIFLCQLITIFRVNIFKNKNLNLSIFIKSRKTYFGLILGCFSFLIILLANKILPLIFYLSFNRDLISTYIEKSKVFTNIQYIAGRNWGGENLSILENSKNLLSWFEFTNPLLTSLLFISISLAIFVPFWFFIYKKVNLSNNHLTFNYTSTIISLSILSILLGSWSFPLMFKFPYIRNVFCTVVFTTITPIGLACVLRSSISSLRQKIE